MQQRPGNEGECAYEALIAGLDRLSALERLPRTGWRVAGLEGGESIADHVLGTALLTMALAARVEPELDVDRAVSMALLHDAPEAVLGDWPRAASELLPPGAKRAAERAAAEDLLPGLGEGALARWREFAAAQTREARFVAACDKLHLGWRLVRLHRRGERGLAEFRAGLSGLDLREFAVLESFRAALLRALDEPR